MTEPLTLLAIKDGMAVGPKHTPAPERLANNRRQNLEERLRENNGIPPERWTSLCGQTGILYRADAEVFARMEECFGCRCQAEKKPVPSWRRYVTDEERQAARRKTFQEAYERRKARAKKRVEAA